MKYTLLAAPCIQVQLQRGATFTFSGVVLTHFRRHLMIAYPGIDLFAPSLNSPVTANPTYSTTDTTDTTTNISSTATATGTSSSHSGGSSSSSNLGDGRADGRTAAAPPGRSRMAMINLEGAALLLELCFPVDVPNPADNRVRAWGGGGGGRWWRGGSDGRDPPPAVGRSRVGNSKYGTIIGEADAAGRVDRRST